MNDQKSTARYKLLKPLSVAGIAGTALILIGIIVSAVVFEGRYGQPYSFLNHFVSELGEIGVSRASWAFNGGLIAGGILLSIFVVSFLLAIEGWFRYAFFAVALLTGVSGTMVGFLPMDNPAPHVAAAMTFFYSGMFVTIIFSAYVLFSKRSHYAKRLSIPGVLSAVFFFALIFLTEPIATGAEDGSIPGFGPDRPYFWSTPFIEWLAIGAVLLWVLATAMFQLKQLCPGFGSSADQTGVQRRQG